MNLHGTTILAVRKNGWIVMGGDGQVSLGHSVMKHKAKKIRTLAGGKVLVGFAGATADAFTLVELFEKKLQKHQQQLLKSAVELAKEWRTDRMLRHLEAMLLVADSQMTLVISGNGDVIEPDEEVIAIGSGSAYAQSAALALWKYTDEDALTIVERSLEIAERFCVYTNSTRTIESLKQEESAL